MPALEGPLVGPVATSVEAFPSGRVPTKEVCKIMEPDEIYKNTGVGGDNSLMDAGVFHRGMLDARSTRTDRMGESCDK